MMGETGKGLFNERTFPFYIIETSSLTNKLQMHWKLTGLRAAQFLQQAP